MLGVAQPTRASGAVVSSAVRVRVSAAALTLTGAAISAGLSLRRSGSGRTNRRWRALLTCCRGRSGWRRRMGRQTAHSVIQLERLVVAAERAVEVETAPASARRRGRSGWRRSRGRSSRSDCSSRTSQTIHDSRSDHSSRSSHGRVSERKRIQRNRSPRAVGLAIVWLAVHAAPQERAVAELAVIREMTRARTSSRTLVPEWDLLVREGLRRAERLPLRRGQPRPRGGARHQRRRGGSGSSSRSSRSGRRR